MRTVAETSGTTFNTQAYKLQVPQKMKKKRKGMREYFRRL